MSSRLNEFSMAAGRCGEEEKGCVEEPAELVRRIDTLALVLFMVVAGVVSFAHRYTMSPDALSYLEVGEAWWRGDFGAAIVGYWSPLFPIFIAAVAKLAPGRALETIPMHFSQLLVLAGAFYAHLWFVRQVELRVGVGEGSRRVALRVAGHSLFGWVTFCLVDIDEVLPDLMLMIWVVLAGGHVLRWNGREGSRAAIWTGLFLGLGYLTKPVLFPLGIILIGLCAVLPGPSVRRLTQAGVAAAVFLMVCAVYIVPLSMQKGRPTFSDSGGLAYAWEVNGVSPYGHWQGRPEGSGTPKHTTRQILEFPPTYEFDTGRPGTYPLWYDASYWNEGLRPRFDVGDQLRRLWQSTLFFTQMLFNDAVLAVLLFSTALGCAALGARGSGRLMRPFLPLIGLSVAACGMYALVFVVTRYLAPFVLMTGVVCVALVCRAELFGEGGLRRWSAVFCLFAVIYVAGSAGFSTAYGLFGKKQTSYAVHARVTEVLAAGGLKAGDKVAIIGRGSDPYFARIGGFKVIAEAPVLAGHPGWPATGENFEKMERSIWRNTAAKAIVTNVQPLERLEGWQEVPGTPYRILPREQRGNGRSAERPEPGAASSDVPRQNN